jgi:hypothetical protein
MNTNDSILTTLVIGTIISIIVVIVERILIITGFARGNTLGLGIVSFLLTVVGQIIFKDLSIYWFGLFIIIIGPVAANRSDITITLNKGRWWWKSESSK